MTASSSDTGRIIAADLRTYTKRGWSWRVFHYHFKRKPGLKYVAALCACVNTADAVY